MVLDEWCSDEELLHLSRENAVPESAFLKKENDGYRIRWFTHRKEIRLCGHATLAAAYVVSHFLDRGCRQIRFFSLAGEVIVTCEEDRYEMPFKAFDLQEISVPEQLLSVIGTPPAHAYLGRDYLLVYDSEEAISAMEPQWNSSMDFDGKLISVTAKGTEYDCVSRTFVPHNRMAEEEACGSAHCHITPYWAKRMGKEQINAYQASSRGGTLRCSYKNGKVYIAGACVLYAVADVYR